MDNDISIQFEAEKRNYFYRYFKSLFTPDESNPTTSFGDWTRLFTQERVVDSDLSRLTEPFNLLEIKQAVFQLGGDKAPGPDGFSLKFYQMFWDTVKEDLVNVFQDLYEGRHSSTSSDYAFITLIPKKEGAARATTFDL